MTKTSPRRTNHFSILKLSVTAQTDLLICILNVYTLLFICVYTNYVTVMHPSLSVLLGSGGNIRKHFVQSGPVYNHKWNLY